MSTATFRQHFYAVTGLDSLQYQKQLCLQQAHLLLAQGTAQAEVVVGYANASRFSREYYARLEKRPIKMGKISFRQPEALFS